MAKKKILPPLLENPVSAGFPSPAEQYLENGLDLNELLIARPVATFFVRTVGDSMVSAVVSSSPW